MCVCVCLRFRGLALQNNIDFRTLLAPIPQRPPKQFKIVPDSRLEGTRFLTRKMAIRLARPDEPLDNVT